MFQCWKTRVEPLREPLRVVFPQKKTQRLALKGPRQSVSEFLEVAVDPRGFVSVYRWRRAVRLAHQAADHAFLWWASARPRSGRILSRHAPLPRTDWKLRAGCSRGLSVQPDHQEHRVRCDRPPGIASYTRLRLHNGRQRLRLRPMASATQLTIQGCSASARRDVA
jgi:hypothetical protein